MNALWLPLLLVVSACNAGTLTAGHQDGCTGPSCEHDGGLDAAVCHDGSCDDGAVDPCDVITCPEGQECIDGRCRSIDRCASVTCENDGEVCDPRTGACVSGATDDDGDGYTIADGDCDDSNPAVHPAAGETCDGLDQDCDLEIDEGFPDHDGDGFDTCGFGDPRYADCDDADPMTHPIRSEACDGRDNDCDGDVDEGIDPRPCETACGEGVERCEGGSWSSCSAPSECDCTSAGTFEEELCGNCGTRTRTCEPDLTWSDWGLCVDEGACGPGSFEGVECGICGEQMRTCDSTCQWGDWGECEGEGEYSPGTSEGCTSACGSAGTRACSGECLWGSCTPPSESCNDSDDDCDGEVDEGFRAEVVETSFSTLVTHHPGCDGVTRSGIQCASAIHRFCSSRPCSTTGFGPIENSGDLAYVTCLAGAEHVHTTYAELATHHDSCDGISLTYGPGCNAAINRFCAARGAVSGYGPVEAAGDGTAWVVCVSAAEYVSTTYTTLATYHPSCDGSVAMSNACNAAIHRYCSGSGRTSGFGPAEHSGDTINLVCVVP